MEKKDLKKVSDSVKGKLSEVKEKVKKEELEESVSEEIEPLVTCRLLFISVLDKIIIAFILLTFLTATLSILFSGDLSSVNYSYWGKITGELSVILLITIMYFFMNWLYKCALKTMLCVTKNEVYKVTYVPFVKRETSIPLNKITGVSAHKVFWIFRCVVVHQYMQIPKVFFTWNAQEFKDKVVELTTTDKGKVKNSAENKNLVKEGYGKYVLYLLAVIGIAFALLGVARFFSYIFRPGKSVTGSYYQNEYYLVLKKDNTCDIKLGNDEYPRCTYTYDETSHSVSVNYTRKYTYFESTYTDDRNLNLEYNTDTKELSNYSYTFIKGKNK